VALRPWPALLQVLVLVQLAVVTQEAEEEEESYFIKERRRPIRCCVARSG